MNTTAKGDAFEEAVLSWAKHHIEEHGGLHLFAPTLQCERQRELYSPDREGVIKFDVVIEACYEGEPSRNLVILECKDEKRPVEVAEVEEFYGKVNQVRGYHVKPIVVTRSGLQAGALKFAKNKGIGVVRWRDAGECEWTLRRYPDVKWRAERQEELVHNGLTSPRPLSEVFRFYFQAGDLLTTSPEDFWGQVLGERKRRRHRAIFPQGASPLDLPFLSQAQFEQKAREALRRIGYADGRTDLAALSTMLKEDQGVDVIEHEGPIREDDERTLGQARFDHCEIHLYQTSTLDLARRRYAWAHEIAHFLLHHGRFLLAEHLRFTDEQDLALSNISHRTIRSMEFQANALASSLLMPLDDFVSTVERELGRLGVRNRGSGFLYLDSQPCNRAAFLSLTSRIMERYGVSRFAAKIRLKSLGILNEATTYKPLAQHLQPYAFARPGPMRQRKKERKATPP